MNFKYFEFFSKFCSWLKVLKTCDQFVSLRGFFWYSNWHYLWYFISHSMPSGKSYIVIKSGFLTFYDTGHRTLNVINHVNFGIKRSALNLWSDLRPLKAFDRNKFKKKNPKTQNPIFPLYFSQNPFVKWNCKLRCAMCNLA